MKPYKFPLAFISGGVFMFFILRFIHVAPAKLANTDIYEQLQHKNDSLIAANYRIEQQYSKLDIKSDSIYNSLKNQSKEIVYIESRKNEKIKSISTLNGHGLIEFFSRITFP